MVTGVINALAKVPGGLSTSHLLRGQAHLMNHQFEKAIVDLEAAARLDSSLPRLQYSLGLAYFKADRLQDSRAAFDKELHRNPRDVTTLWYLASIDEMEGKLDDARSRLDRARRLDSQSPDVAYLLGKVMLKQGKAAEASELLKYAVDKDPLDTQKRYQLARAYQQLGRREDAAKEFAEVQRIQSEQLEKDKALIIKE
jgi:predicted Zn-dependent protease